MYIRSPKFRCTFFKYDSSMSTKIFGYAGSQMVPDDPSNPTSATCSEVKWMNLRETF